jgi:hypothetical protein
MREEGIGMPKTFPIVIVEADSYKQACKRILALSSQYGKMSHEGLKEFMNRSDISFNEIEEEFEFDAIDFQTFSMVDDSDLGEDSASIEDDPNKKFILQVTLPTEMDLRDLYDDLLSKGFMVKEL